MTETIIYVKDEKQKKELKEQHPDVDAEWIVATDANTLPIPFPIVCKSDAEEDICESGERFIEEW